MFWRQPFIAESVADRVADPAAAGRDRHPKESDAEPGGAALHRVCPRGRQAAGTKKIAIQQTKREMVRCWHIASLAAVHQFGSNRRLSGPADWQDSLDLSLCNCMPGEPLYRNGQRVSVSVDPSPRMTLR